MWVYSQRSVSVLCYSMCLCLWGGAPWTVNIGPAGEGRSLLCAWHGPVSVSDSLPAESTATIPLRLAPSLLLSSSPFFSSVFFFLCMFCSRTIIACSLQWNMLLFLGETFANPVSVIHDFYFFFCIRQLKSEDYTALMGCECSVFLWIRKSLRKHIWVKWKKTWSYHIALNQADLGTL